METARSFSLYDDLMALPDGLTGEILSPSTESKDRQQVKLPIYARYGVASAWLVDPLQRSLEAFELEGKDWKPPGIWQGEALVAVPPFADVPLALGELWS